MYLVVGETPASPLHVQLAARHRDPATAAFYCHNNQSFSQSREIQHCGAARMPESGLPAATAALLASAPTHDDIYAKPIGKSTRPMLLCGWEHPSVEKSAEWSDGGPPHMAARAPHTQLAAARRGCGGFDFQRGVHLTAVALSKRGVAGRENPMHSIWYAFVRPLVMSLVN